MCLQEIMRIDNIIRWDWAAHCKLSDDICAGRTRRDGANAHKRLTLASNESTAQILDFLRSETAIANQSQQFKNLPFQYHGPRSRRS